MVSIILWHCVRAHRRDLSKIPCLFNRVAIAQVNADGVAKPNGTRTGCYQNTAYGDPKRVVATLMEAHKEPIG